MGNTPAAGSGSRYCRFRVSVWAGLDIRWSGSACRLARPRPIYPASPRCGSICLARLCLVQGRVPTVIESIVSHCYHCVEYCQPLHGAGLPTCYGRSLEIPVNGNIWFLFLFVRSGDCENGSLLICNYLYLYSGHRHKNSCMFLLFAKKITES